MTVNVFLVRHGQTESNLRDFYMGRSSEGLNKTGLNQVRLLAARLAKQPVRIVYTSPLRRTLSTAEIICEPHNLKPVVTEVLTEINLGDWEGHHVSEIKEKWPGQFSLWRADPSHFAMPGGENMEMVTARAVSALNVAIRDNTDKTAVIVSHEYLIKVLVQHVLGVNGIFRRFRIDNASLTVVSNKDDSFRLITLNDTAHLE